MFIKMNEIYQNKHDIKDLEIESTLEDYRTEREELARNVNSESTEGLAEKKFPPTDSF
ncbi:hypothetical protein IKI14_06150 [bacterium]|nr:hypothetical protein [bacterium]